jgi:hypothetical protein
MQEHKARDADRDAEAEEWRLQWNDLQLEYDREAATHKQRLAECAELRRDIDGSAFAVDGPLRELEACSAQLGREEAQLRAALNAQADCHGRIERTDSETDEMVASRVAELAALQVNSPPCSFLVTHHTHAHAPTPWMLLYHTHHLSLFRLTPTSP